MSPKKGVLSGPKINKKHSTYNNLAEKVIVALKPHPAVKKIVLGPIKPIGNGLQRLTVREDRGQVRIQCRDITSVQILWAIGVDPEVVKAALKSLKVQL